MKYLTLSFLLLLFFLSACALFRAQPSNTNFSFEFENETYEIIGYTTDENDSANFLIHRVNGTTLFRVIDRDQDGILERVVTGSIELERANRIYNEGIRQARELGLYKEIESTREFEHIHEEYRLIVQSYTYRRQSYVNRFIIYDLNWIVDSIFWDDDSNGILNRKEIGERDLDDAQVLYDLALQHASESERIDMRFKNRMIISENKPDDKQQRVAVTY